MNTKYDGLDMKKMMTHGREQKRSLNKRQYPNIGKDQAQNQTQKIPKT